MRGFFLTYIYINILINLSNMLKTFFLFISLIFIYSCNTNFEPSIKSLSAEPNPSPPGEWVDHPVPDYQSYTDEQKDSLLAVYDVQAIELYDWWIDQIYYNPTSR